MNKASRILLSATAAGAILAGGIAAPSQADVGNATWPAPGGVATDISQCALTTNWHAHSLKGVCGDRKFKVKGNGYNITRLKGKIYGKKTNIRLKNKGSYELITGTLAGKKIKFNKNAGGTPPNRRISYNGNNIQSFAADFTVNKSLKGWFYSCEATGRVTGPDGVSWGGSRFTQSGYKGGKYVKKNINPKTPMWGACAALVTSSTAFNGT